MIKLPIKLVKEGGTLGFRYYYLHPVQVFGPDEETFKCLGYSLVKFDNHQEAERLMEQSRQSLKHQLELAKLYEKGKK